MPALPRHPRPVLNIFLRALATQPPLVGVAVSTAESGGAWRWSAPERHPRSLSRLAFAGSLALASVQARARHRYDRLAVPIALAERALAFWKERRRRPHLDVEPARHR